MAGRRLTAGVDTGVLAWGLFVAAGAAALRAVVLPVNQLTQPGGRVKVHVGDPVWPDTQGVVDVAPLNGQGMAYLQAHDLPTGVRLLTEAGPALGALAWAIGLALTALVIRDIGRGSPFGHRVPIRIAGLAVVVLIGGFASTTLDWLAARTVVDQLEVSQVVSPTYAMPLGGVLLAALLLVLAEAFRQGQKMSAELDGLV